MVSDALTFMNSLIELSSQAADPQFINNQVTLIGKVEAFQSSYEFHLQWQQTYI